jgi:parallel beta-helix repeat protein
VPVIIDLSAKSPSHLKSRLSGKNRILMLSVIMIALLLFTGSVLRYSEHSVAADDTEVDACPVRITHSSSQVLEQGQTVGCIPQNTQTHNDNWYYRAFNMSTFGVAANEDYNITSVDVGIDNSSAAAGQGTTQPMVVRLYAKIGPAFPSGYPNMGTKIGEVNVDVPNQVLTVMSIPLVATVPAGTNELIMEVFTPSGVQANNLLMIGGNDNGQTGPSYLRAPACGSNTPVTTDSIGFPGAQYVLNVNGSCPVSTPTPTPSMTPTPALDFIVTNTNDSGAGSLRQAVIDANAAAGSNTIGFDSTVFSVPRTITLTSGHIQLAAGTIGSAHIYGPGAHLLTISGNNNSKIFTNLASTVSMSEMTLTGGNGLNASTGNTLGGAIYNNGHLTLNNLIIRGNSATVDGGGLYTAVSSTIVCNDCLVTQNIANSDNNATGSGGGAYARGSITFNRSTISYNTTLGTNRDGGGLASGQSNSLASIRDSNVVGNTAALGGGIGVGSSGQFQSIRSTISGNQATSTHGGAIMVTSGNLEIQNSTISGNTAAGSGGAIYRTGAGPITGGGSITLSTIVNNRASAPGGGLYNAASINAHITVRSSILANNTDNGTAPDLFGTITSGGFNLIESVQGATINGDTSTNITGTDPDLGPLQNNGGTTLTHMPNPGSPVIDKALFHFLAEDQRGNLRPFDNPSIPNASGGDGSDIGSVEVDSSSGGTPTPSPTVSPSPTTTATPTITPTVSPSPTPAGPGKIVFQSMRDGNWEIYLMNPDGTGQTNLTNNAATDVEPSLSPDGEKVAFSSFRNKEFEIYVINVDGTGLTQLTNVPGALDTQPKFSPDGSKIVFYTRRHGNDEIYIMNSDGTGQIRLTDSSTADVDPIFSPDGSKIAFASSRDGNQEVYLMNTDGTGLTRLTNNAGSDYLPAFSPDGMRITFVSSRDGDTEIFSMKSDGSDLVQLTSNTSAEAWPSFSPTGDRISYVSNRDGNFEIYVMNSNGSDQTRLTTIPASDQNASWGPSQVLATSFTISGRVISDTGRGLAGAKVAITDSKGISRSVLTSSAGYFTFENVPTGSATVTVVSKRYRFSPRQVQVNADKLDVDFVGVE